jgi:hypothetical protein
MSKLYAIKAVHPATTSGNPHVFAFAAPRTIGGDSLFEVWNGPEQSARVWAVDKDGRLSHGTVPWARLSDVPASAQRWPTPAEIGAAPAGYAPTGLARLGANAYDAESVGPLTLSLWLNDLASPDPTAPWYGNVLHIPSHFTGLQGALQLLTPYIGGPQGDRLRYRAAVGGAWTDWREVADVAWADARFAPLGHRTPWASIDGAPETATTHPTFAQVRDKPATFPHAPHRHQWGELDGVPATFPATAHRHDWSQIDGRPATYAPSAHRHNAADIDGVLPVTKGGTGQSYAPGFGQLLLAHYGAFANYSLVAGNGIVLKVDEGAQRLIIEHDPGAGGERPPQNV